jgi:20S proteasome alpha/beta subunit
MSLGIVVKGPEGLVLAAESRVTLTAAPNPPSSGPVINVNFDNATKLLSFSKPHTYIGVVTYGLAALNLRTAASFVPEFEATLKKGNNPRISIQEFAKRLSAFYMQRWTQEGMESPASYKGPDMVFIVAGFDKDEPYGSVFEFGIPSKPDPQEKHPNTINGTQKAVAFGISWGGQREIVDRLIHGHDGRLSSVLEQKLSGEPTLLKDIKQSLSVFQMPIPLQAMALQDCVDLALFFIRTTIEAQKLTIGVRGCGGPIDVAIITSREPMRFIQRKRIVGESGLSGRSLEARSDED